MEMIMLATVINTNARGMLVRDSHTNDEIRVHYPNARRFSPGDRVSITFDGAMTPSIPPQITAISIRRAPDPPPPFPREIRATILLRRHNSLVVRDANNRRIIVNFRFAHHFCTGQRVIIRHNSVIMNNPIVINACDITPVCSIR